MINDFIKWKNNPYKPGIGAYVAEVVKALAVVPLVLGGYFFIWSLLAIFITPIYGILLVIVAYYTMKLGLLAYIGIYNLAERYAEDSLHKRYNSLQRKNK